MGDLPSDVCVRLRWAAENAQSISRCNRLGAYSRGQFVRLCLRRFRLHHGIPIQFIEVDPSFFRIEHIRQLVHSEFRENCRELGLQDLAHSQFHGVL